MGNFEIFLSVISPLAKTYGLAIVIVMALIFITKSIHFYLIRAIELLKKSEDKLNE